MTPPPRRSHFLLLLLLLRLPALHGSFVKKRATALTATPFVSSALSSLLSLQLN